MLQDRIPVANSRYRRSQSADRWVDHRPGAIVPVETILQPLMRRRRSVTRLTSPREITDGASRYCLVAQQQDSEGELETKLYKVNIIITSIIIIIIINLRVIAANTLVYYYTLIITHVLLFKVQKHVNVKGK